MKKYIYHILFGILMLFLFLPMIQEKVKLNVRPLYGVTYKTEFPKLEMETFNSGKYQSQLEKYIAENFGFREIAIRWYNQYVWTFFNKTYNKSFVRGKDNWFYYFEGIRDYKGNEFQGVFKTKEKAIECYEKNIAMMLQLREILKEYGIEFMTFMAPDKPFIYPEYLPDTSQWRKPLRAFEYYDQRFTELGFPNIEMTKWFTAMRDTLSHPVMHTIDSHWGVSSVYGCDSLFRYLNSLNDFGMPQVKYGYARQTDKKPTWDEKVLNLLFPIIKKNYNYELDITVDTINKKKPRILFVGDSFIWSITKEMPLKDMLSDMEIWYYNSTVHKGFDLKQTKKENINSLVSILKSDYVVFYSCGHQWHKATFDFLEQTLADFGVTDSTTNHDREKVERALMRIEIEKDKEWSEKIRSYSITNDISLDEAYEIEVSNILNNDTLIKEAAVLDEEALFNYDVEQLVKEWRNNPKMMEYLKEKAAKKGKPLEDVILGDAKWVVKQKKK